MTDTRPLADRWHEYRDPNFVPSSFSDEVRHAVLSRPIGYTIPVDLPSSRRSTLHTIVGQLETYGYEVVREGNRVRVANREHEPSAAVIRAHRQRLAAAVAASPSRQRAASEPAPARPSRPSSNGSRRRRLPVELLPSLGDGVTVSAVGFAADGRPFVVVTSEDGWRFSCTVDAAEAPIPS